MEVEGGIITAIIGSKTYGNGNAEEIRGNLPDSEIYEKGKKYLKNSLVRSGDKIYISIKNVPPEVDLDNENYWQVFMNAADSERVDELISREPFVINLGTEAVVPSSSDTITSTTTEQEIIAAHKAGKRLVADLTCSTDSEAMRTTVRLGVAEIEVKIWGENPWIESIRLEVFVAGLRAVEIVGRSNIGALHWSVVQETDIFK